MEGFIKICGVVLIVTCLFYPKFYFLGPILKDVVDRATLKFNCLEGQQNACEQVVNDVQKTKDLKFYFYSGVVIHSQ